MSLWGYKKKSKPATWTTAFPSQVARPLAATGPIIDRSMPRPPVGRLKQANSMSARRRQDSPAYRSVARQVVREAQGRPCWAVAGVRELREGWAYGHPISARVSEAHHIRGRAGSLYADKRGLVGMAMLGHRWVNSNPDMARELWLLCPKGLWGVPFEAGKCERCNAGIEQENDCLCASCSVEFQRIQEQRERDRILFAEFREKLKQETTGNRKT